MVDSKKTLIGRVKNRKDFKGEGRTSLLIIVKQEDNDPIVPKHVNLCVETADVNREDIRYGSIVGFQALNFVKWRIGKDRFLGPRQSQDRNDPRYHLPQLTNVPNSKFGKLGDWANLKYLEQKGIDPELYLHEEVTPITSLVGFNPDSVGLIENYEPEIPTKINIEGRMYDYAEAEARRVEDLVPESVI